MDVRIKCGGRGYYSQGAGRKHFTARLESDILSTSTALSIIENAIPKGIRESCTLEDIGVQK